ncbi:MAG: thiol reductase thioredoxin [Bacteroidetes bacterium]|nr:MAG: thiol reductase thioredoxin [Bacteroidota bacterium]PIE88723.1 MAG: thiol reductase thioredoxin [Bacteroidota bacterium]
MTTLIPDSTHPIIPEDLKAFPAAMLYFYNDKCAPCVALKPKIHHLVEERFPKIEQFYFNAVQHESLCATYGVFSSPIFIFFFEGKEVYRGNNYVSLDEIERRIGRLYDLMFSS